MFFRVYGYFFLYIVIFGFLSDLEWLCFFCLYVYCFFNKMLEKFFLFFLNRRDWNLIRWRVGGGGGGLDGDIEVGILG